MVARPFLNFILHFNEVSCTGYAYSAMMNSFNEDFELKIMHSMNGEFQKS